MIRVFAISAAILTIVAASLFFAPPANAGLVEDLRSGKSNVRAVSHVGLVYGLLNALKELKRYPDFKAMAYSGPYTTTSQAVYGAYSAQQAIETALEMCTKEAGSTCFVYAVGDQIVTGYTQEELADEIAAYDPAISGKTYSTSSIFCKRQDGSVYRHTEGYSCNNNEKISEAEYARLKNQSSASSANSDSLSGRSYCKRADGSVYITWGKCVETTEITKTGYDRLEKWAAEKKLSYCKREDGLVFESGGSCGGAVIITKAEYDRRKNAATDETSAISTARHFCKRRDGSIYTHTGEPACHYNKKISEAEYARLKSQKSATSRKPTASAGIKYCKREDGSVFRVWDTCRAAKQVNESEYYYYKRNLPKNATAAARTTSIKEWLKSIGLERYEAEFRRNDITLDIISELTDADLKEIGIKSLGVRKRILKAAN